MARTIQPEILDSLAPDHPDALHNRRDLRWTNFAMGNHRWIERTLRARLRPAEPVLELGAGTGELIARLARGGFNVDGLDRWPAPAHWPPHRRWHQADLRAFARYGEYPVIIGNLIFHQFREAELQALGTKLRAHPRLLIACEPARSRISQIAYRVFAPLFGANYVSLHDAHVSIDAGFRADELAQALGLDAREWTIECGPAPIGAYHLVATRRT